jgi:hypothetical protein
MTPKIFCTGWQRTGTTSLAAALNRLGIPTLDYPWQLLDDPHHPVLDEYAGFTDVPIPLMYRDLDARFPGSKFIHTERSEDGWLKSAAWLMETAPRLFHFDSLPKAWEMIEAMYGTRAFNAGLFLARYRRHNAEVRAYFASRPADLLFLDITAGDNYAPLCAFLGKPVPAEPFPHRNTRQPLWRGLLRQNLRKLKWKITRK